MAPLAFSAASLGQLAGLPGLLLELVDALAQSPDHLSGDGLGGLPGDALDVLDA